MNEEAKWAVVLKPLDVEGSNAWGPFDSKDAAERWLNQQIDRGDSNSDALYKRGYVVRLDPV